jgi:DNA-binding MarR family transcriptional regulator
MRKIIVPDDTRLLAFLNNMGIITQEKQLTLNDICTLLSWTRWKTKKNLQKLIKDNYVNQSYLGNRKSFYLTPKGILKASGTFS